VPPVQQQASVLGELVVVATARQDARVDLGGVPEARGQVCKDGLPFFLALPEDLGFAGEILHGHGDAGEDLVYHVLVKLFGQVLSDFGFDACNQIYSADDFFYAAL
jgi:hypothetical protein